jgi:hypothetical protein
VGKEGCRRSLCAASIWKSPSQPCAANLNLYQRSNGKSQLPQTISVHWEPDCPAVSTCLLPSKSECHVPQNRDSQWFFFSLKRFAFNIVPLYG